MIGITEVRDLCRKLTGQLIMPGEPGYSCIRPWTLREDQQHRAAFSVVASSVEDVQLVVNFARKYGLRVVTQNTGHGSAAATKDTIVLIPPRGSVSINGQTATLPGGARWLDVNVASLPHNLIGLHGLFPWVGVPGYSLFGGIGPTVRKRGIALDSILEISLITADGEFRCIKPGDDLFWAMCGGGGEHFGVVTGMKIRLFPNLPITHFKITASIAPDQAQGIMRRFREWAPQMPPELTSLVAFKCYGSDDPLSGTLAVILEGYWCGSGSKDLMPHVSIWEMILRSEAVYDTLEIMPSEIGAPPCSSFSTMTGGLMLRTLDDHAIEQIAQFCTCTTPFSDFIVRYIGGELNKPGGNSCAFRDATVSLSMYARIANGADDERIAEHLAALYRTLTPGGIYLNYMIPTRREEYYRLAYPTEVYQRLCQTALRYDPEKVFGGIPN